jgi:repressor of nif and glnA expression
VEKWGHIKPEIHAEKSTVLPIPNKLIKSEFTKVLPKCKNGKGKLIYNKLPTR